MKNIEEFVSFIREYDPEPIYRTYVWAQSKKKYVLKTIRRWEIERENESRCIYYIPSIGGTKNKQIRKMMMLYVDLDCGRPGKDQYYDDNTVREYKARVMKLILLFAFPPSLIIETRNGYHVYWKLAVPVHEHFPWREIQGKLTTYFNGDYAVCSPHQPMRLPFTMWRKKKEGLDPFVVAVVESNDAKYRIEDFEIALRDVQIPNDSRVLGKVYGKGYRKKLQHGEQIYDKKSTERPGYVIDGDNRNVEAIASGEADYLQSVLNPEPKVFSNYQECFEYLTKEVDLAAFLGISENPDSCCCVVHDDGDPSAGIIELDTGEHFYNCFACGVRGNIRSLVQFLQNVSHYRALEFLKRVYRIEIRESEWQQEKKRELLEIKQVITNDLAAYPHLYDNIRNDLPLLYAMVDIAVDNVYGEKHSDAKGNPIFWTSIRYLAKRLGLSSRQTIGTKIVSLCLHGLLRRIPPSDVPPALLSKSMSFVVKHGKKTVKRLVSYYRIPSFAIEDLIEADDRAKFIQESDLGRAGYSYEGISRTFGPEAADAIYVDRKRRGISEASDERVGVIHEIAADMIEHRGWATTIEIQEQMEARYKRTLSRLTIKRALPEMLQAYGWIIVWWTKELRERFQVSEKVAGKIIINPGADTISSALG